MASMLGNARAPSLHAALEASVKGSVRKIAGRGVRALSLAILEGRGSSHAMGVARGSSRAKSSRGGAGRGQGRKPRVRPELLKTPPPGAFYRGAFDSYR